MVAVAGGLMACGGTDAPDARVDRSLVTVSEGQLSGAP